MRTSTPLVVVNRYLDAIAGRDFEMARSCLADTGFRYLSPIAEFADPDAFVASMEGVGAILHDIKTVHSFVDGDTVCHVLDVRVSMSGYQTRRVVQLAKVREGHIVDLEVLFDASEYRRMFGAAQQD